MAAASPTLERAQAELKTLLNGPADTPPPDVVPGFDNPPNLDYLVHLTLILCIILTSLAVFIRMYTRHVLLRSLGYDDCECHPLAGLCCSDTLVDTSVVSWVEFLGIYNV